MAGMPHGGPLLSVGDLLQDLSEAPSSSPLTSVSSSRILSSPNAPLDFSQSLQLSFEKSYNDLNVALGNTGHSWTGSTEKLCAALTTADKLVATVHLHLGLFLNQVHALQSLLERGCAALSKLQTATGSSYKDD